MEFLERAIGRSETIFSVSSRVLQMHRPELLDDAGDMFSVMGWAYQRGVGREMKRYDRPCRIFSACAAAAFTGGRFLKKSAILTRCILPIWRTLTWLPGQNCGL